MLKEAKRDADVEKVCRVFGDYIKASPYLDWLWSDKLGYVLMQINLERQEIMESHVITDAERLCWILFNEIADDVLERAQNDHTTYDADLTERLRIQKRLKPYTDQLPEYSNLCEKLWKEA